MESAAVFHYSMGTVIPMRSTFERPGVVSMHNAACLISNKSPLQGSAFGCDLVSSQKKLAGCLVSCAKSSEVAVIEKSNGFMEKSASVGSTFPNGFEELVLGVCDETQIAELKMKIGGFEMHLKRNIKSVEVVMPVASPTEAPPIPSKPMTDYAAAKPPTSQKATSFTNVSAHKSKKLAALEASGANGYVLVSCPTVGTFRKSRTLKGKKQPILIKEGDVIKEGQTICYLDQFGTELPVKSDAAGEVIKILFDDGEALGYGDPIIAVLPSFHDIKNSVQFASIQQSQEYQIYSEDKDRKTSIPPRNSVQFTSLQQSQHDFQIYREKKEAKNHIPRNSIQPNNIQRRRPYDYQFYNDERDRKNDTPWYEAILDELDVPGLLFNILGFFTTR